MSGKDSLGDRMKGNYEDRTRIKLPRRTYTIIRIDGKTFHSYTRGLGRPFDDDFMSDMVETARFLLENIQGTKAGYVQSDEISLLLTDFDDEGTEAWFDGNLLKVASVSASMATAQFNQLRPGKMAFFDSRAFTIPDPVEVMNYFRWRYKDAQRNSVSMMAQAHFKHSELQGKSSSEMRDLLSQAGTPWESLHSTKRNGTSLFKINVLDTKTDTYRSRWHAQGESDSMPLSIERSIPGLSQVIGAIAPN